MLQITNDLRITGEGQKQLLAFVDAVGVHNLRIGLRDAVPRCCAAVLGLRDLRQGVALLNGNFRVRFNILQSRSLSGHDNLCAGSEMGGVHNARVGR